MNPEQNNNEFQSAEERVMMLQNNIVEQPTEVVTEAPVIEQPQRVIKQPKKSKKTIIIAVALILILLVLGYIFLFKKDNNQIIPTETEEITSNLNASDVYISSKDVSLATINPTKPDQSGLLVKNRAVVTVRDSKIFKQMGETSDSTNITETGLNSATVVSYGSEVKFTNTKTETTIDYANGLFISGEKAKANLIDSEIQTYGYGSNGIVVSTKGYLETNHVTIITKVKAAPAVVLTHNQSTALLTENTMIETNGSSSPAFKTKGTLTGKSISVTSNGSRIAEIEGGIFTLNDSMLIANGAPNNPKENPSAFLIEGEESTIKITNSNININRRMPFFDTAIIFDLNNATNSNITLKNTTINQGSKQLMNLTNSKATFNADSLQINGGITLDNNSSITINLKNNTLLMGNINKDNTSKNVTLKLDKTSKLILDSDTYVTALENENPDNSNIICNNYKLYVNGVSIN